MYTAEKVISHFSKAFGDEYLVRRFQDFLAIGGTLINIRTKTAATYHRKTKQFEFGIPKRDWERYLDLVRRGKMEVYSLVIEKSTDAMYLAKVSDLATVARVYLGDAVDEGGTVFLPRDTYERKESLDKDR